MSLGHARPAGSAPLGGSARHSETQRVAERESEREGERAGRDIRTRSSHTTPGRPCPWLKLHQDICMRAD